ncbi:hypothetical protein HXY33_08170 [Candidatus Bathyarchaeota archaeon]|nr:hypothetical protein [Candidatus Bathyarchaeota archaeon]
MKKKLLSISVATIMVLLACASLAQAAPTVEVDGYTDKPYYKPGETVTLKFWVYNLGPEDIVLKNVTIEYPWYSVLWGGNKTIKNINAALTKDQNWTYTDTFTIPTDGRATGGYVTITYTYTYGSSTPNPSDYIALNVASVPWYGSFENMDKIVTLFTVLVVLVIVGAVIVAATIFLAMRRPQVSWKAEQKTE